jgi:hypothetical protein
MNEPGPDGPVNHGLGVISWSPATAEGSEIAGCKIFSAHSCKIQAISKAPIVRFPEITSARIKPGKRDRDHSFKRCPSLVLGSWNEDQPT